jgi:RHS repeat-associated protein
VATNIKNKTMKELIKILILLVTAWAFSQQTYTLPSPSDGNYLLARSYQKAFDKSIEAMTSEELGEVNMQDVIETIQYFDGLGRKQQTIAIGHTPNGSDLVTPYQYDKYGRMAREWLPFPSIEYGRGVFKSGSMQNARQYYQNRYTNDFTGLSTENVNAYSERSFEPSPLNRVLKQGAPGNDWALGSGHEIAFEYATNSASDNVKLFYVTTSFTNNIYNPTLELDTDSSTPTEEFYGEGVLYKNITKDENHSGTGKNHTTEEFTNKQGQVVLKRTYADYNGQSEVPHDTYYVYDDFGNLTYVIPPKVDTSDGVSVSELTELCYQYIYDHRNRLVEKKLPGKGWEYIVYNKLDQPIMTQDANQRTKQTTSDEWLFTKYDAFGRVAYTGKATAAENTSRTAIQNEVDNSSSALWVARGNEINVGNADISYNDGAYPNSSSNAQLTEILTINYYDDYNFDRSGTGTSHVAFGITTTSEVKGLPTGTKVKVLDVSGTNVWITTVTFYDEKARPIYTYSHNDYLGTVDIVSSQLDFVGKPLKVRSSHRKAGTTIVTLDNFTYDHTGRLLTQTQCIGDDTLGNSCDGVVDGGGTEVNAVINDPIVNTNQVAISSITIRPTPGQSVILRPGTGGTTVTLRIDPNAAPGGGSGSGNTATSAEELIVSNTYDALGQLESKMVGGDPTGNGLQTVDYNYNVRGWLKQINNPSSLGNDLFAFGINYNTVSHGGTSLYNGNIAETEWRTANTDNSLKWYKYEYDALNRITNAIDNTGNFNLNAVTYDKHGNIITLSREGPIVQDPILGLDANNDGKDDHFGNMDGLTYLYSGGNKLIKVTDWASNNQYGFKDDVMTPSTDYGDDYSYDANGNMIRDENKSITAITYNYLNLPTQITLAEGTISYIYDAAGVKLKKVVDNTTESSLNTTEYAGNYIYENNNLQFFSTPEGYVQKNGNVGFEYVYQYKDHLGNVRLSYTDNNGTLQIIEENNYYPFGLRHKGYNNVVNGTEHQWKYNGKELNESLGLNWYDYGARRYQADIGRWTTIDPAANEYVGISPYSYAANNPMVFTDPDGKRLFFVGGANNDQDGWEYITRWGNYMTDAGIKNFVRVNASNGKMGDVMFTNMYRSSGTYYESVWKKDPGGGSYREYTGRELPQEHNAIDRAVDQITSNLEENPLEEGEQFNLAGYSYGSVLQAQAALRLANDGQYIDNLILIGSPIADDSKLMKQLKGNKNIGNVLRVDIEGDLLSNPKDILEFIKGGAQNSSDDGPHFDLARPGDEANSLIQTVIQWLQQQGVE